MPPDPLQLAPYPDDVIPDGSYTVFASAWNDFDSGWKHTDACSDVSEYTYILFRLPIPAKDSNLGLSSPTLTNSVTELEKSSQTCPDVAFVVEAVFHGKYPLME